MFRSSFIHGRNKSEWMLNVEQFRPDVTFYPMNQLWEKINPLHDLLIKMGLMAGGVYVCVCVSVHCIFQYICGKNKKKKQVIGTVWNKSTCHLGGCPDSDIANWFSCADLRGELIHVHGAAGCSAGAVKASSPSRSPPHMEDDVCACRRSSVLYYLSLDLQI